MPIDITLTALAAGKKVLDFVSHTASRTISIFLGRKLSQPEKKPSLPAKVQEVRIEPRVRQEEAEYSYRREAREKELVNIQADLARVAELRFKADMQIEAAKAEREEKILKLKERELKLKQEELADRRELSALYLDVLREQNAQHLELKKQEIQAMFDQQRWPGVISRDEAERIFVDEKQKVRLLMLVPPPDISDDFPLSFRDSLKKEVRNKLKIFLETYYPLEGCLCPVEFYGKYFERAIFDAEVKQLETILSAVPTAVIYSDVTDHEVYFNARFWGLQETVSLSFEPWDWEVVQQELLAEGKTEKQSLRIIRQIIVTLHKLYAAFLADWYYLNVDPNYKPKLFDLEAELPSEWTKSIIKRLRLIKKEFQDAYLQELKRLAEEKAKAEAETVNIVWSETDSSLTIDNSQKTGEWVCVHIIDHYSDIQHFGKYNNALVKITLTSKPGEIASFGLDNMIKIWDFETGKKVKNLLEEEFDKYNFFKFHPQKNLFFSSLKKFNSAYNSEEYKPHYCLFDNEYNIVSIEEIPTQRKGGSILLIDFRLYNEQEIILIGGENRLFLCIGDKEQTYKNYGGYYYTSNVNALSIFNENTILAGSLNGRIKILNYSSINRQFEDLFEFKAHDNRVNEIIIFPNNEIFASASNDGTVKLWRTQSGELIYTFEPKEPVFTISLSPDEKILANAGDKETEKLGSEYPIKLWNLKTKELIRTLYGHSAPIHTIYFASNEKLVSASENGEIKIWECT